MRKYFISTLLLLILTIKYLNAASLKVLHGSQRSQLPLFDTTVKEVFMKDIKIGDESHIYKFEVGKWSCEASFVRLFPESAGDATLNCGNHDGLVVSSTGDAATYLEISDGRDAKAPVQRYEIRLVGKPAK